MDQPDQAQINNLAAYLADRREQILQAWRAAIRDDPELTVSSRQSRAVLDDHVPAILKDFERRLRVEHSLESVRAELDARQHAAEHAIHRWERGYDFRDAMKEWGHLQLVVIDELDRYTDSNPSFSVAATALARRTVAVGPTGIE